MIYQGLDFDRDPLPADQIAADLDYFLAQYRSDRRSTCSARRS